MTPIKGRWVCPPNPMEEEYRQLKNLSVKLMHPEPDENDILEYSRLLEAVLAEHGQPKDLERAERIDSLVDTLDVVRDVYEKVEMRTEMKFMPE